MKPSSLLLGAVFGFWALGVVPLLGAADSPTTNVTANSRLTIIRDPFWPVGFVAPIAADNARALEARAAETEWDAARKLLVINGVMRATQSSAHYPFYAIINGQFVETGGVVSVSLGGKVFRWRVVRITENGPEYERQDVVEKSAKR
jgi:hypothetical protein